MALNHKFIPKINKPFLHSQWVHVTAVLIIYAGLLLPVIDRQGISWDEQNDLWIAQAYLDQNGWLEGSDIDPSQARLPMFSTALVYILTGRNDLLTGRWVSALVGGLTILGIYIFAKQRNGHSHGVLAAGILATSPFFLSFARVAFTETDVFLACAIAWLMVVLYRLQQTKTLGWAATGGILFGLAISTKFTALALSPGIWYAVWQGQKGNASSRMVNKLTWFWAGWLLFVAFASWKFIRSYTSDGYADIRTMHYILTVLCWILPIGWAFWQRNKTTSWIAMACFITAIGLLTFFIVPPDHLTNPEILNSLFWRVENEMGLIPAFIGEAAALHLLSIVFKSSPLVGFWLLAGWGAAIYDLRNPARRFPLLLSAGYFCGLLILPIAQTFYAVPLLPILAVFAGELFLRIWQTHRRNALIFGILTAVLLGIEITQCYPDYNLNGYQWLGARPLFGRSSISYRSVVQTPSDGVQQGIEYINTHAKAGEQVLVYAMPWHIIHETANNPQYKLLSGYDHSLFIKPDYVMVHFNILIWNGWHNDTPRGSVIRYPYDPVKLGKEYKLVFRIPRAFGLEAVSIWKRITE